MYRRVHRKLTLSFANDADQQWPQRMEEGTSGVSAGDRNVLGIALDLDAKFKATYVQDFAVARKQLNDEVR